MNYFFSIIVEIVEEYFVIIGKYNYYRKSEISVLNILSSSKYKSAIPKYDITSPVRVCDDCYQSLCNENGKSLERSISDYSSGKQNHRSRKNTTTAYGLLPTKLL